MHLGVCTEVGEPAGDGEYEWIEVCIDSLEIEDDPAECGFHFMGIDGCEVNGYDNPLNDGTNVGAHPVGMLWMYRYGDGVVLLKEGDGFVELHRPRCRNAVGVEGTRLSPGGP